MSLVQMLRFFLQYPILQRVYSGLSGQHLLTRIYIYCKRHLLGTRFDPVKASWTIWTRLPS